MADDASGSGNKNNEACEVLKSEMPSYGYDKGLRFGADHGDEIGAALGATAAGGLALASGAGAPGAGFAAMGGGAVGGLAGQIFGAPITAITLGVGGYLKAQWIAATSPETCADQLVAVRADQKRMIETTSAQTIKRLNDPLGLDF